MRKRKLHVAIVDDDQSVSKALARLLSKHFTKVEIHGSAEEFLIALKDGAPDCLILDLQMPGISGLDLQCHMLASKIHIPTVIFTAHNEPDLRRRCEAAGASVFLTKPLTDTILVEAINSATAPRAHDK